MKYFLIALILVIAAGAITWSMQNYEHDALPVVANPTPLQTTVNDEDSSQTSILAQNLQVPWAIAFLPDKSMLVTQRSGTVRLIDSSGTLQQTPVVVLQKVKQIGEGGLLGIALHPNYRVNHYVYLYYTYSSTGSNTKNRVVRMTYDNGQLIDEKTIVDVIPGASNHNGGRIKFGPDNFLYIGTGDAQEPSQAQDKDTRGGKILRVTDEGKPAPGNPYGNDVFSYGHRNVQGLAWDSAQSLWATEHGRSGVLSGLDELNLIEKGKNYGWPIIEGNETRSGMVTAKQNSGSTTWAPSGAAFIGNKLYFSGLKGQSLYEATIENNAVTQVVEHLKGQFGRIREVIAGPDGMLYITTSNTDGRGNPLGDDDKVIRVNPTKL